MLYVPLLCALVASSLTAQQPPRPESGLRLFGSLLGSDTSLVDTNGAVVHTWTSAFAAGTGAYLLDDGSLLRSAATVVPPLGLNGAGGGVQRIAFDGRLLWDWRSTTPGLLPHHDLVPMPNGNVLLIVWEDKTVAQAVAAGRDPALIASNVLRPDSIYELQPTGATGATVVWHWHVFDHLVQGFDATKQNFAPVAQHPELIDVNFPANANDAFDFNHCNGIDYDAEHDWIAISAPRQNEIWIIDHGTTIAEAAGHSGGRRGHGGDLLYRWGNPLAYRAGTAAQQQLFFQHDPQFVRAGRPGAGHLTVFNNNFDGGAHSAAIELVLPLDANDDFVRGSNGRYGPVAPLWNYTADGFQSPIISSVERLPGGNTLICSGAQSRVFEVTASGAEVWSYTMPVPGLVFHAHYVDRSLWCDTGSLSVTTGGTARMHLVAGSAQQNQLFLLLGSLSGTTPGFDARGLHMPLNPDFLTDFTGAQPNSPMLVNTLGLLSPVGGATASFVLPAGLAPTALIGARLDFAAVIADAATLQLRAVSTPAGFTLAR